MNALRSIRSTFFTIRNTLTSTPTPEPDSPDFDPQYKPHSSHETEISQDQLQKIYHTAFLLQQKLTRDVVHAILSYTDLHTTTTSIEEFDPSLRISQREAPWKLIECQIARVRTHILHPVRKITFTIFSHDQGFASERNRGSWTWFTARKCSPEMDSLPDSMFDSRAEGEYSHHREICSNVVASRQWRTHVVTWRADSEDPVEAEWVGSFVRGDRFAVYAWANYPAWVNHVGDINVTVHYVAVV